MLLKNNDIVLFQGDSITDCGRDRDDPASLGAGYPALIAALFDSAYPDMRVRFLNRGVSGDRAINLRERWDADCLDLRPNVLSILIGINDTWRRYDRFDPTTADVYENNYRYILSEATKKLNCRLLIIEPFLLHDTMEKLKWREDLDPKIQAARRVAAEFGALYLPMDGLFAAATMQREPKFWAADGVHPTPAGHAFIARAWLKLIGGQV